MRLTRVAITLCLIFLTMRCIKDNASGAAEIPRIATVQSIDSASLALLDRMYPSAITPDSSTSAFSTEREQDALGTAWPPSFHGLRAHLDSGGIIFKTDVGFHSILHCDSNGRVDHFLYEVEGDGGIVANVNFIKVATSYVSMHGVAVRASRAFAQCGSIRLAATARP